MSAVAEAIAFRDALDHAGRGDLIGRYHADDWGRSDGKHAERERVLDFMLPYLPAADSPHAPRLLTLPGTDWLFERLLLQHRPRTVVTGLERSFTAFARSRMLIPAGPGFADSDVETRDLAYGSGTIHYARRTSQRRRVRGRGPAMGHATKRSVRSHRLLLMDLETYATMLVTDYGATLEQRKGFYDRFCRRTAIWLDLTSQLCPTVERAWRWIHLCADPSAHGAVPLVITLRNGRDDHRGIDSRIARLCEVQPAFKPRTHWTYAGANGVSMLTVCGDIEPTNGAP